MVLQHLIQQRVDLRIQRLPAELRPSELKSITSASSLSPLNKVPEKNVSAKAFCVYVH